MFYFWQRILFPLSILVIISLMLWLIFGALPAVLFFAAVILLYHLFHLYQLLALEHWLTDPEQRTIPDGRGLWEEVFAKINKVVRGHQKERAQRMAALQHLEQATSALPEGVVILGEGDRIEWCNPLAEKYFGLSSEHDIGQQITYLARQPQFVEYLAQQDFAEPLILRGMSPEGLILSIKLILYGEAQKLLICRDITRFEHIETMRSDFVANVTHELRTPLTVVNGFVETLHDMPSLENEMARRAIHLMGEQTQRMERLVDDLLTLSRLEDKQNPLHEELIDAPALLRTLHQEGLSLSAQQHNVILKIETDLPLSGNYDELHSAFGNLLSNAIRYTPKGGDVVLSWQSQNGQPAFSVRDSGIGIDPKHIPRLTERFYRVDKSRSRETGGTGLGLAIVKHVANRHHAQLLITSEEGRGSTFSIIFPAGRVGLVDAKFNLVDEK